MVLDSAFAVFVGKSVLVSEELSATVNPLIVFAPVLVSVPVPPSHVGIPVVALVRVGLSGPVVIFDEGVLVEDSLVVSNDEAELVLSVVMRVLLETSALEIPMGTVVLELSVLNPIDESSVDELLILGVDIRLANLVVTMR